MRYVACMCMALCVCDFTFFVCPCVHTVDRMDIFVRCVRATDRMDMLIKGVGTTCEVFVSLRYNAGVLSKNGGHHVNLS